MAQKTNKQYIDGVWLRNVWVSEDGESRLISFGADKEKFIEQLQEMEANDKGIVNLTIGTTKSDTSKYSLFVDDFKPQSKEKPKYQTPAAPGKNSSKQAPAAATKSKGNKKPSDDLPF